MPIFGDFWMIGDIWFLSDREWLAAIYSWIKCSSKPQRGNHRQLGSWRSPYLVRGQHNSVESIGQPNWTFFFVYDYSPLLTVLSDAIFRVIHFATESSDRLSKAPSLISNTTCGVDGNGRSARRMSIVTSRDFYSIDSFVIWLEAPRVGRRSVCSDAYFRIQHFFLMIYRLEFFK